MIYEIKITDEWTKLYRYMPIRCRLTSKGISIVKNYKDIWEIREQLICEHYLIKK